jgi:hypothetical protein
VWVGRRQVGSPERETRKTQGCFQQTADYIILFGASSLPSLPHRASIASPSGLCCPVPSSASLLKKPQLAKAYPNSLAAPVLLKHGGVPQLLRSLKSHHSTPHATRGQGSLRSVPPPNPNQRVALVVLPAHASRSNPPPSWKGICFPCSVKSLSPASHSPTELPA